MVFLSTFFGVAADLGTKEGAVAPFDRVGNVGVDNHVPALTGDAEDTKQDGQECKSSDGTETEQDTSISEEDGRMTGD